MKVKTTIAISFGAALLAGVVAPQAAQAQVPFTFTDDCTTAKNVTFISNSVAPYQYGLYQKTVNYLGNATNIYGYYNNTGGNPPTAFGLYDATTVPGGATGAQFTSMSVTAVIATFDTSPVSGDMVLLTSNTPIANSDFANPAGAPGVVTETPLVTGPVPNTGNADYPFYTFTAAFAPARYALFGVVETNTVNTGSSNAPVIISGVGLTGLVPGVAAPEPSEFAALGLGVLGLGVLALRARKRTALNG